MDHPTSPTPTTPGGWLRHWRQAAGISQVRAAAAIGATQGAVSHWERDRYPVSIEDLRRLVALYGVPAEEAGWRMIAPAAPTQPELSL